MNAKVTVQVEHEGTIYDGQVMRIKSTSLGYESHGILTCYLHCEYPGGGIGVGGYCLDKPRDKSLRDYSRQGTAYGLDYIIRTIETVGAESWEQLPGTDVIVLFKAGGGGPGGMSVGIAGLQNGRVLILKDHAEQWTSERDAAATQ